MSTEAKQPSLDDDERRRLEQVDRLYDLMRNDDWDNVTHLSRASLTLIENWHRREAGRINSFSGSMARVTEGGRLHENADVNYLINILAGDEPDLQQTAGWLANHQGEVTAQFLAELISAAMAHGAMTMMSDIAAERHVKTRAQRARALQLWHEEYKPKEKMSKGKAAPRIAAEVGLAITTVRRLLQGQ